KRKEAFRAHKIPLGPRSVASGSGADPCPGPPATAYLAGRGRPRGPLQPARGPAQSGPGLGAGALSVVAATRIPRLLSQERATADLAGDRPRGQSDSKSVPFRPELRPVFGRSRGRRGLVG